MLWPSRETRVLTEEQPADATGAVWLNPAAGTASARRFRKTRREGIKHHVITLRGPCQSPVRQTLGLRPPLRPPHSCKIVTVMPEEIPDFAILYRRAFEEFGAAALWSSRPVPDPTPADALAITNSLRVEGSLQARRLAEQIERACRAAV